MSDADWDADDFEPPTSGAQPPKLTDKWDGEDEDDDIKDSWDKDSEEEDSKGSEGSGAGKAMQRKKKKKLADIIAEKERAKMTEAERLEAERAAKEAAETPEGKLAEKLRKQKMEELDNLEQAREMLGVKSGSIDAMIPVSKDDFDKMSKAICEKVLAFNSSSHYNEFVENLVKDLCLDLPPPTLKKVKIHVESLHSTKLKEEKAKNKTKPAKGKSSVKMDLDKDLFGGGGGGEDLDDFDDFM